MRPIKVIEYIFIFSSVVSLICSLIYSSYFYEKVIYRGYEETLVWLDLLSKGEYAGNYYYVIEFICNTFGFTVFESVYVVSTITLLIAIYAFKVFKNHFGTVCFFIIFNVFTLLLIFSPGRTAVSIIGVILFSLSVYPRVSIFKVIASAAFLSIFHPPTVVLIFLVFFYKKTLKFVDVYIKNELLRLVVKLFYFLIIALFFVMSTSQDIEYTTITDGSGNVANIILIFFTVVMVYIYIGLEDGLFFLMVFILLIFVFGINPSYAYRTVFIPMSLLIFIHKIKEKELYCE